MDLVEPPAKGKVDGSAARQHCDTLVSVVVETNAAEGPPAACTPQAPLGGQEEEQHIQDFRPTGPAVPGTEPFPPLAPQ